MEQFKSNYFISKFIKTNSFGFPNHKIMIVMHGLGDQLDSYIPLVKEINVTGMNYVLINAPRTYPIGFSWYDIPPLDPRPSINESLELLSKLIKELINVDFSYEDIYIMGFSQGGAMSIELANFLNKKLGGVLALSPRIYMNPYKISQGLKDTPFFSSHGRFDDVIPFKETHQALMQMKPQIKDFSFFSYDINHEICYDEIVKIREWLNNHI